MPIAENQTESIRLSAIDIGERLRALDENTVERFMVSISGVGLIDSIIVARKGRRYTLVAGWHRYEAYKRLGRKEIPAVVATFGEAREIYYRRLWEED